MSDLKSLRPKTGQEYFGIETIPVSPLLMTVTMDSDEVSAICPVTGQPDWYIVAITFQPRRYGIESKSLKLYLQSFRNEGIFSEDFAVRIATDIAHAARPYRGEVTVIQKPRGGVSIKATASMPELPDEGDGEMTDEQARAHSDVEAMFEQDRSGSYYSAQGGTRRG